MKTNNELYIDSTEQHFYNITYLQSLCRKHKTRGQQLHRKKIIQIYTEKYPTASASYLSKLIDLHCGDIIQADPRTIHPQYAAFLVECMTSVQKDPQSPYRVRGRGNQKIDNTKISEDFFQKFPEAGVTPEKIKRKCGQIRKELQINLAHLPK